MAVDDLIQMVLRATVWLKEPKAPNGRACDRCCDTHARAKQKKMSVKGRIEVSCSRRTLTVQSKHYRYPEKQEGRVFSKWADPFAYRPASPPPFFRSAASLEPICPSSPVVFPINFYSTSLHFRL